MKRILLLVFIGLSLTACDNHMFTQFFNNPHVVDIAKIEIMKANKWYEFKTKAKALNREQELVIDFKGGEPNKLDFKIIGYDENYKGGSSVFTSKDFPNSIIDFNVEAEDSKGVKYKFRARAQSSGIIFVLEGDNNIQGKVIRKIKIKSNLRHEKIKITWVSFTRK